jgi:hypothetical protein
MDVRCSRCDGPWITGRGMINTRIGNGVCSYCHSRGRARKECRICCGTGLCRTCGGRGRVPDYRGPIMDEFARG